MSDRLLYHCRVCGIECPSHPVRELPNGDIEAIQAVCEAHCEDHDYEYLRDKRGRYCKHCDKQQPIEEYDMVESVQEKPVCELCGEPMPAGEEMFKYHGYSGECPKPPLLVDPKVVDLDCDCGAVSEGKWAAVHSPKCMSAKTETFARELSHLGRKLGLGITGDVSIYVLEQDDFLFDYSIDADSKLHLGSAK